MSDPPPVPELRAVAFDLGGVLLDWNPRHLYRQLFAAAADMEHFLATVCTPEWNLQLDAGLPFERAVDDLVGRHPEQAELIRAYRSRWPEMVAGPLPGMVELLDDVRRAGLATYVVTNSSHETYPLMARDFPFLGTVDGVVVSGELRALKPAPEVFRALLDRFHLDPPSVLFVDDLAPNVAGARACGLQAVLFTGAEDLRRTLRRAGAAVPERPRESGAADSAEQGVSGSR